MQKSSRANNLGCLPVRLGWLAQLKVNELCAERGVSYVETDLVMDELYDVFQNEEGVNDYEMTVWEVADSYMPPFLFPGPVLVVDNGPRIG